MSRTEHRKKLTVERATRKSSRPAMTKGENAGGYDRSAWDVPANRGSAPSAWSQWAADTYSRVKDRRIRATRALLKVKGRRADRHEDRRRIDRGDP